MQTAVILLVFASLYSLFEFGVNSVCFPLSFIIVCPQVLHLFKYLSTYSSPRELSFGVKTWQLVLLIPYVKLLKFDKFCHSIDLDITLLGVKKRLACVPALPPAQNRHISSACLQYRSQIKGWLRFGNYRVNRVLKSNL